MILGSPQNNGYRQTQENISGKMDMCAALINDGQYEEAWTLLDTISEENILLHFNRAICLISGCQDYAAALPLLEQTWTMASSLNGGLKQAGSAGLSQIRQSQNQSRSYQQAVTQKYIELFPYIFKDTIQRLIVDCHFHLGNYNKVLQLGTPLQSKNYKNVMDALEKSK